jgi:hypothetical protein
MDSPAANCASTGRFISKPAKFPTIGLAPAFARGLPVLRSEIWLRLETVAETARTSPPMTIP